jgi:hypothetical protein
MHESSQKCKTFNLELLKKTKFNIVCYTCPNEQVRYSIASCWHQLQDHQVSQPLDEAQMDLGNFAKNLPLMSKVLTWSKHVKMAKPHKLHARTTILIIRPSQIPTSTSCHVNTIEPCVYFYIWDFSMVDNMQRFSTQRKLNWAHMTWEHIFQPFYISFSDSNLVHKMSLRQKGYAPPQDKARGLNIHDGKWAFGSVWSII